MGHSRVLPSQQLAGIITRIQLENFMCHSSLEIELGEWVNFITGPNGSGKSAILTALFVAFGCSPRGTQRVPMLKDYIKTGCSYANVHVEIKNQGEDAYKPEVYGDGIIIEKKISEVMSSTVLMDHRGRKVGGGKEELHKIIEHFKIDVENPCVIMSRDKSREFLHSGDEKKMFKFFFKATFLEQVFDLLLSIDYQLNGANVQLNAYAAVEKGKFHCEQVVQAKASNIERAEVKYQGFQVNCQENCKKASNICVKSEVEALGCCTTGTLEQLVAQIKRLNQRLLQNNHRHPESIDELGEVYKRKQSKVSQKQETCEFYREKLKECQDALDLHWIKFQRNATFLKRHLSWQFDWLLRKKGIRGCAKVNFDEKTLSLEFKMPQDASSNIVRDMRGLSDGERSFATLCFALAVQEMTEGPFRAVEEFDMYMDEVSRKISLDTIVDYALAEGSQWIFITRGDISMVNPNERVRKLQMVAPCALP